LAICQIYPRFIFFSWAPPCYFPCSAPRASMFYDELWTVDVAICGMCCVSQYRSCLGPKRAPPPRLLVVATKSHRIAGDVSENYKKIDGPPPPCICYIPDPPTHQPTFVSLPFFLVHFFGVSR
jgi:hypothetical protein